MDKIQKAKKAIEDWKPVIGEKKTVKMLKNVVINAIDCYAFQKDGEDVLEHVIGKIVEVMHR